jgi:hypothetical protein
LRNASGLVVNQPSVWAREPYELVVVMHVSLPSAMSLSNGGEEGGEDTERKLRRVLA